VILNQLPVDCVTEVFDDGVELIDTHVVPIRERQLVRGGQTLKMTRREAIDPRLPDWERRGRDRGRCQVL
jgi:hypothetical protein